MELKKMVSSAEPRRIAVRALTVMEQEEIPCHLVIRREVDGREDLTGRDRQFCRRLIGGTVENLILLDYCLNQVSNTPVRKMKPEIRAILRSAVYQILFMNSVPDRAAVNEAVRIVPKKYGRLKGFVNGVLRNIAGTREKLRLPDPLKSPEEYLSVRGSVPMTLLKKWIREYGYETTVKIVGGFSEPAPLTVRFREDEDSLIRELKESGVSASPAPYVKGAWNLSGVNGLAGLPAFSRGALAVQDVSSMLAVLAAGIREGDVIVDLCAAPGGKSLYASDLAGKSGKVISRDLTGKKADLIRENANRLGACNLEISAHDATVFDPSLERIADVVLADVPCSGFGVIRRKPDIKYRWSEEKTKSLKDLQRSILKQAVRYVRPGGTLIFSTCTFNPEENEENTAWITENSPLIPVPVAEHLPEELKKEAENRGYLQLLPGIHPCDGFFIAKFYLPG
jgi:16S rRNA (cytosine967-C5)-methyltransferase